MTHEFNESVLTHKEQCPVCASSGRDNSSDNLGVYDDGHKYCFACNYFEAGGGIKKMTDTFRLPTLENVALTSRGISIETTSEAGVGLDENGKLWFPYYDLETNKLVAAKFRTGLERDFMWDGTANKALLFGTRSMRNARTVILTEGETDCLACREAVRYERSVTCLGIPKGAGSAKGTIQKSLGWLRANFDKIVVAFDNDEAGEGAVRDVVDILPAGRTYVLSLPLGVKDIGELVQCNADDFRNAYKGAVRIVPAMIANNDDLRLSAVDYLYNKDKRFGASTGFPSLDKLMGGFGRGEVTTFVADTGVGKGVRLDETLPTPRGFVKAGEVRVGDFLFSHDGTPTQVTYVSPHHNLRNFEVVFDDGTSLITDESHLWQVDNLTRGNRWNTKVLDTLTMFNSGATIESNGERKQYRIPLTAPVQYAEQLLTIDPYIFGVWLGDGTSCAAAVTTVDAEILDSVSSVYTRVSRYSEITYGFPGGLHKQLRETGVLCKKHVPDNYMVGSVEQRIALVQGLMDTDGTVSATGVCTFDNTNEGLVDSLRELLHSLGLKANKTRKCAKLNGREISWSYRVNFTPTWFNPFRLSRKAARVQLGTRRSTQKHRYIVSITEVNSAPTVCFQVDNEAHLFLAGKSYTVTHNTKYSLQLAYNAIQGGAKVLYIPLEMTKEQVAINLAEFDLQTKLLTDGDIPIKREVIEESVNRLLESAHFINHFGAVDVPQLVEAIEVTVDAFGVSVVFLDHITGVAGGSDVWKELEAAIKAMKQLALSKNIHVFVVSHTTIDKKEDKNGDTELLLGHIRGSRSIAQWSDCVLGMMRPRDSNVARIKTLKVHRTLGRYGQVHFEFEGNRFYELESEDAVTTGKAILEETPRTALRGSGSTLHERVPSRLRGGEEPTSVSAGGAMLRNRDKGLSTDGRQEQTAISEDPEPERDGDSSVPKSTW